MSGRRAQAASRRWQLAVRLSVAALVWSLGLVLAALLVPTYASETSSAAAGLTLSRATLAQSQGAWAVVLVTVPALVSVTVAAAMLYRRREGANWSGPVAWTAIGLLAIESLLGILSVGAFMLPVAILLALTVRLVPVPERSVT
jgi:hypothetical protein